MGRTQRPLNLQVHSYLCSNSRATPVFSGGFRGTFVGFLQEPQGVSQKQNPDRRRKGFIEKSGFIRSPAVSYAGQQGRAVFLGSQSEKKECSNKTIADDQRRTLAKKRRKHQELLLF
jgi:hypothetical protein